MLDTINTNSVSMFFLLLFTDMSSPAAMIETPHEDKVVSDGSDLSVYVTAPEAIFWCTLFILEAVLITIGNLLTTVVFLRSRKLRKRRYYLIINLAISDGLVGALAMPQFILPFGKALKVWKTTFAINRDVALFFDMFAGFASIAFLTMISLERLYATLRPFCYRALKSRWYVLLTIIAWATAGCIPSIHLLVLHYHSSTQNMMVTLWVPFLSAQLLIICISYLVIWRKVKIVNRSVGRERAMEKESSLSRICLLVTAVSVVAWLPFVVMSMIYNSSPGMFNVDAHAFYFTKFLHYSNSLLNPVLYVVKIPEFKESLTHLFNRNAADPSTADLNVPLSAKVSVRSNR